MAPNAFWWQCAFKCGRRAPDAIPKLAPVFAADVHRDDATLGPCRSGVRLVELEIGFRLLSDPPDLDDPDYLSRLRACVEMLPALEIVDSRLVDRTAADGAWQLADNQNSGRIVLGTRFPGVKDIELDERDVLLEVGGRELHRGPAPVPGGDAFLTFAAFARTVGTHCGGPRAGQTCITGALVGPCPAQAGDRIRGRIEGLGTVSARFDG